MRPVAPRIQINGVDVDEVVFAEEQLEFVPLTVAVIPLVNGARMLMTRWRLSPDERKRIAEGADLYIAQISLGPMIPFGVSLDHTDLYRVTAP